MTAETTMKMPGMPGGFFPWWLLLLQGIIALILGIFLLTSPYMTLMVLIVFLGAYWFVGGIFTLFSASDPENRGMKILLGFLGIILGLAILAYPYYSTFVVPFIFIIMVGVWALIIGALHIYQALTGGGWGIGLLGLFSVILGLILLFNPYLSTLALPFVLGILGIIFGFAAIVGAFMVRSQQKAA